MPVAERELTVLVEERLFREPLETERVARVVEFGLVERIRPHGFGALARRSKERLKERGFGLQTHGFSR